MEPNAVFSHKGVNSPFYIQMIITKTIEIDLGHRIPNHSSKCKNLHGHRYKIEVGVDGEPIQIPGSSSEGMVLDFSHLKEIMIKEIDTVFDHGFVLYEKDELTSNFTHYKDNLGLKIILVPFIPTAENLAKHWYDCLRYPLLDKNINIKYVKVFETPTSTATYAN